MTRSQESDAWTGKGGKYNTDGKGGEDRGKGSFKGDTRGGMGGKGMSMFIETNKEIIAATKTTEEFAALLGRIRRELEITRIARIAPSSARS